MTGQDPRADASSEYEAFERRCVADDRDAASVRTVDVDDATAESMVSELIDAGVVTPVPEQEVLVHEPSGAPFQSVTHLAMFHRGWMAARAPDEADL